MSTPNPWTTPPEPGQHLTVIGGQLCVWDDEPAASFGQVWIPVCVFCRQGPLEPTKAACNSCLSIRPAVAIGGWL